MGSTRRLGTIRSSLGDCSTGHGGAGGVEGRRKSRSKLSLSSDRNFRGFSFATDREQMKMRLVPARPSTHNETK